MAVFHRIGAKRTQIVQIAAEGYAAEKMDKARSVMQDIMEKFASGEIDKAAAMAMKDKVQAECGSAKGSAARRRPALRKPAESAPAESMPSSPEPDWPGADSSSPTLPRETDMESFMSLGAYIVSIL